MIETLLIRFLRKPTYLILYNPKVTIMTTLMKYFYFNKLIEIILSREPSIADIR